MELNYKIALINVFWSKNDINTRYFETIEAQKTYFDNLIEGKGFSPLSNFNMNDNVETIVTFTDESGRDAETLCKTNYAVVIRTDDKDIEISRRYYFAYSKQDSGNQMRTMLELDDIQTNYFPNKDKISECLIRRACLNRFNKTSLPYVKFNGEINSTLFTNEGVDLPKRLIKRFEVPLVQTRNQLFNQWLKNNVAYWVYIFFDKTVDYKYISQNQEYSQINGKLLSGVRYNFEGSKDYLTDYGVFAYPIMKTSSNMYFNNNNVYVKISQSSLTSFKSLNPAFNTYIYAKKISMVSPFDFETDDSMISYTTSGDVIIESNYQQNLPEIRYKNLNILVCDQLFENNVPGLICYINQNYNFITTENIKVDYDFNFTKNEIINSSRNLRFNPKMLSQNVLDIQIMTNGGEKFSYDLQKMNTNNFFLIHTEPIQAEITKSYTRINRTGLYSDATEKSFIGLVEEKDNSVEVANSYFSQYLANNRNFWLQTKFKLYDIGFDAAKGFIESAMSSKSGTPSVDPLVSGLRNIKDMVFSIDNMRGAPGSLKNATGNAIFEMSVNPPGIYIEIYEALEDEKKSFDDYIFKNGFLYNKIGKISDFDNIRKYFNYIEANVELITADISDKEKERLRDKLKSIRFWNVDNIDFSKENYERWLES